MSYSPVKFVFFLKSRLIFNRFYCFCTFVNKHYKHSQTLRVYNSRILRVKTAKFSGYYFYMSTNIQGDFEICIRVPLIHFIPLVSFYTPWKHQRISDFLIFKFSLEFVFTLFDCDFRIHLPSGNWASAEYFWRQPESQFSVKIFENYLKNSYVG